MELLTELDAVNIECLERWNRGLDFRIGINSGEMVFASYGSSRLGTFSVAGDSVEFARRLAGANTVYGSRILTGSHTLELALHAVEVRPMELVRTPRRALPRGSLRVARACAIRFRMMLSTGAISSGRVSSTTASSSGMKPSSISAPRFPPAAWMPRCSSTFAARSNCAMAFLPLEWSGSRF